MKRKQDITNKIIEAAVDEFLSKGIEATSMETISKKAEVSKRTLYKYFPHKELIFDEIVSCLLACFESQKDLSFNKDVSIKDQLSAFIDKKVGLITDPQYLKTSKLVLGQMLKENTLTLKEEHILKIQELEQSFDKWISEAKKAKAITSKESNQIIADSFHAIIKGQLFYPILFGFNEPQKMDIEATKRVALEFFIRCFCS